MNGVHDLGGTDGLGPVVREQDEPVWHADWEKVCFALFPTNAVKGYFGVDEFRYGIEQMHPAEYLLSPYYEHWLHTATHYTVKAGVIDPEELERRTRYYLENPDAPVPEKKDPELAAFMETLVHQGVPARRESDRPAKFAVGDRVRVKDDSPFGHTRRARYIRGRTGEITAAHGTFIYPDSAGNGQGDDPQHVYTVVFKATDLWGEHGDPNSTVTFDVWEPYLEPAPSA
jgi:nitrile hydratase subunit beta